MKNKDTLGNVKQIQVFSRALKGSLIALAVFVLGFVFLPYIIAEANATTARLGITWGAVSLEIDPDVAATEEYIEDHAGTSRSEAIEALGDSHGNVEFGTLTPTASDGVNNYGTMVVLKKTIGVETSGTYYSVYLSTANSKDTLYLTDDSTIGIEKTSGTWASPATLTSASWGYAVPGTSIGKSSSDATTPWANLGQAVLDSYDTYLGEEITYVSGGTTYTSTTWANVPVYASPQQIYKDTTSKANGFGYDTTDVNLDTDNTFDVYYAVMVDSDIMAGTYQNNIVYTALASAASLDQVSTNLARYYKYGGEGDTQAIAFDLTESALSSSITYDKMTVYVVPHADMKAANYDVTSLSTTGLATCAVDSDTFTVDTRGYLTCTMPAGTTGSGYDFWVHIDGYNYNYVSHVTEGGEDVAAYVYAGLQTKKPGTNDYYVTKMQEMTPGVCKQTNVWNKKWGNMAKVYTSDATDTDFAWEANAGSGATWNATYHTGMSEKLLYDTTGTLSDAAYGMQVGIGTFELTDERDGKKYVVRRLGDGECWMAQNLDLELYTGMTLTSENTDLNSKDEWEIANSDTEGTADAGSTSTAWQSTHGITSVTLYQGTWDGSQWDEGSDPVEACTGGTPELPCFATTTAKYYVISDAGVITEITNTNAATLTDNAYTTAATAYTSGFSGTVGEEGSETTYIGTFAGVTYNTKQVTFDTSTTSNTSGGYGSTDSSAASCTMYITYAGALYADAGYCRVETTGPATITQYDGMSGYGVAVPNINSTTNVNASYASATTPAAANAAGATASASAIATSAGDFRWQQAGADGAHVYDQGLIKYRNKFYSTTTGNALNTAGYINTSNTTLDGTIVPYETADAGVTTSAASDYQVCSNSSYGGLTLGTTSGTLTDAGGTAYTFKACTDTNGVVADSGFAGNWYNWYAATAGSGTSTMSSGDASDSICPKGWRLPGNSGAKSFANLLSGSYGLAVGNNVANADTSILTLSSIRSRLYRFDGQGSSGRQCNDYDWSMQKNSDITIRSSCHSESRVVVDQLVYAGEGYSVRCVAR